MIEPHLLEKGLMFLVQHFSFLDDFVDEEEVQSFGYKRFGEYNGTGVNPTQHFFFFHFC